MRYSYRSSYHASKGWKLPALNAGNDFLLGTAPAKEPEVAAAGDGNVFTTSVKPACDKDGGLGLPIDIFTIKGIISFR